MNLLKFILKAAAEEKRAESPKASPSKTVSAAPNATPSVMPSATPTPPNPNSVAKVSAADVKDVKLGAVSTGDPNPTAKRKPMKNVLAEKMECDPNSPWLSKVSDILGEDFFDLSLNDRIERLCSEDHKVKRKQLIELFTGQLCLDILPKKFLEICVDKNPEGFERLKKTILGRIYLGSFQECILNRMSDLIKSEKKEIEAARLLSSKGELYGILGEGFFDLSLKDRIEKLCEQKSASELGSLLGLYMDANSANKFLAACIDFNEQGIKKLKESLLLAYYCSTREAASVRVRGPVVTPLAWDGIDGQPLGTRNNDDKGRVVVRGLSRDDKARVLRRLDGR